MEFYTSLLHDVVKKICFGIQHIFWIEVSSSNGLPVICRTTYTFHVEVACEGSVFFVRDLCMFRVPRAHNVFVGPGFEPLTLQHDFCVGSGFDSRARLPVSGP